MHSLRNGSSFPCGPHVIETLMTSYMCKRDASIRLTNKIIIKKTREEMWATCIWKGLGRACLEPTVESREVRLFFLLFVLCFFLFSVCFRSPIQI
jgi:hypothetical protein